MTQVAGWVQDLVESTLGKHLEIGMVTVNPETGKSVKIVSGQYWGTYGLSNSWCWREVLPDGSLSETLESGYGWCPEGE